MVTLTQDAPELLQKILDERRIPKSRIVLRLKPDALAKFFGMQTDEINRSMLTIKAPFELRRLDVEGKIIVDECSPQPDHTLVRSLARAHTWVAALRGGRAYSVLH